MAEPAGARRGRVAVALACTGLGRVSRGMESATRDLFGALKDHAELTLFKGAGRRSAREVAVPNVPRGFSLAVGLTGDWRRAYRWEQLSFALGMAPHLLRDRFQVVHFMDGALAGGLLRLRRLAGLRFRLLMANGGGHTPPAYERCDFVQLLSPAQYREAREFGIPERRLFMVPLGVDGRRFAPPPRVDRPALRRRYRVPSDAWVVLCVSALNSSDKRVDWVIRETAALGRPEVFLLLCGQRGPESAALERLSRELLPGRHAIITVPEENVPEVYWLADAFALGSLREGFGVAVVEAASAGLPLVVHNNEHMGWLTGHPASRVDMAAPGELARRLEAFRTNPELGGSVTELNHRLVRERFSWEVLRPQYVAMYEAIAGTGRDARSGPEPFSG